MGAVLGLVLILAGSPFFAYFYNHHVFPLARLARTIEIEDQYEDVRAKLEHYYESRKNESQVEFVEFESTRDLRHTRTIPKAKGLAVYDLSIFGDVQLTLLFDERGCVSEVLFVGD